MEVKPPRSARNDLQGAFVRYTKDTLAYIYTLIGFCSNILKWTLQRESDLFMLMDIKDRADRISLNIDHVTKSKDKGAALLQYLKSKFSGRTAGDRLAELEAELAAVLKAALAGLEKLDCFLDAVEKLAVTSLQVFMEENKELHLHTGMSLERVQVILENARNISPQLLEFKRDASVFFLPRIKNVDVLAYQLDVYIKTTQIICVFLKMSLFSDVSLKAKRKTVVDFDEDISDDDVQTMLRHINQLEDLRSNQNFRVVSLFPGMSCLSFMKEFGERRFRMREFLKSLQESALQLDRMNKGAKISSVAGSSVGAVGGVLTIVGLALIPVTAGVSLGLTLAGVGMGVTSGVNGVVTAATEFGVNRSQKKKANEALKSFMEDVDVLQKCLRDVINLGMGSVDVAVEADQLVFKDSGLITSAVGEALQEGKALRNVVRVVSEVPDIGQAAAKGLLALSKSARAGLIVANSLFIGMDVFFICKDSISLHKNRKPEVSQFIRARAELWSSEMDSWEKIHDSLHEGLLVSQDNRAILDKPFYPEMEVKQNREREKESAEVDGNPGGTQCWWQRLLRSFRG
ncbi:uncharacterized protein apol [Brachionichthys hirsutus]|uniref:uncharacterized protein apol n=1 Tax=Brachionichthys hirsutus TaxID=412623 RepID=UPI00360529E6